MASINNSTHPEYNNKISSWIKFRRTYEAGSAFIEKYVEKFSVREDNTDFNNRKAISYIPAFAKAAVIEIKNAIYQRMADIIRRGGTPSFQAAIKNNVNLVGDSMTSFIGRIILPELLVMSKVGVYIDRSILPENASLRDAKKNHPYIYEYTAENIMNWSLDSNGVLKTLLLKDWTNQLDDNGLVENIVEEYRLLRLIDNQVTIELYDKDGELKTSTIIGLNKIPFVIFEISDSILTDVASYQIALANLASADISYAVKANFPYYVEQFSPGADIGAIVRQAGTTGEASEATKASAIAVKVGSVQGRRYPKGMDRPGFINPSSEPLEVSMKKEDQMKKEIKELVHLAVQNIEPRRESAESKRMDERGLEAGLSAIGLELEYGERQIAEIWKLYEKSTAEVTISYPTSYDLRTDEERRQESKELKDIAESVPSSTLKRKIMIYISNLLLGSKISSEDMAIIENEIENAEQPIADPKVILNDHDAGLVSDTTASKLRGYKEGEVELAKKDHADRAARIAEAQGGMGARGVPDLDDDPSKSAKAEKK